MSDEDDLFEVLERLKINQPRGFALTRISPIWLIFHLNQTLNRDY